MVAMEEVLDCSGMCKGENYFMFTDLNKGLPGTANGCLDRMQTWMDKCNIFSFLFIYYF